VLCAPDKAVRSIGSSRYQLAECSTCTFYTLVLTSSDVGGLTAIVRDLVYATSQTVRLDLNSV